MDGPALTRREFLRTAARFGVLATATGLALSSPRALLRLLAAAPTDAAARTLLDAIIEQAPPARYWISSRGDAVSCTDCHAPDMLDGRTRHDHEGVPVRCLLCARECLIPEGERGECRTRINVGGTLRSLVYGRPITTHVDPIEKKPFFHFLPGSQAFSLATSGCPLHCRFCQNWEISQARPEDYDVAFTPPSRIVGRARMRGVPVIAFTYNEPTVFSEYLLDIASEARDHGIRSVLISCGFMGEVVLADMCHTLAAIKIDLKGFSEEFYRKVSRARLAPVLRSIRQVHRSGTHLEIVNLVVPTLNDSDAMLSDLVDWILQELGPDVPVHFTRFHPDYQLANLPPTPVATLEKAWHLARDAGIRYAYVGNVPGHPGNNTYCPGCGAVVIGRRGFFITEMNMNDGKCSRCGTRIAGVWK